MSSIPFYATQAAAWLRFGLMSLALAATMLALMWYKDGQSVPAGIHMAIAVAAAVGATCW